MSFNKINSYKYFLVGKWLNWPDNNNNNCIYDNYINVLYINSNSYNI